MKDADFLRAILENPADDTPRLVYADWLEEHGNPDRAAFIRVQIEMAGLPDYDVRRLELRRREQALLKQHQKEWWREVQAWAYGKCRFHRGFLGEVQCPIGEFVKGADGLRRRAPIEKARLRWTQNTPPLQLGTSAALEGITALHLENPLNPPGLRALLGCTSVANLKDLTLPLRDLEPAIASALENASVFGNLTHLRLGVWGYAGGTGLIGLLGSPHLGNLTTLRLSNNRLTSTGCRVIASSPHLAGLTTLSLSSNYIGPQGGERLAAALPRWRLETLILNWNRLLLDPGLAALAASPGLASVAVLSLIDCGVGDAGILALVTSPHAVGLRYLELAQNRITAAGARALADSDHLANLTLLSLWGNPIDADGIEALASSRKLSNLRCLLVSEERIDPALWSEWKQRFGPKLMSPTELMSQHTNLIAQRESVTTLDYVPDVLIL